MTANTGVNPSVGRYAKSTTGVGRGGYNPPVYGGDYYNYTDKGREEGMIISFDYILISDYVFSSSLRFISITTE